jgi:nucleoside 2-deoxyribosyltransferase
MRIYFAIPITQRHQEDPLFPSIISFLQAHGHLVLTEHLGQAEARRADRALSREAIFHRDRAWLGEADALLAEVTTPSTGVGYEIATALQQKKPVLCLAREGIPISAMVEGNPELTLKRYHCPDEALEHLVRWLEGVLSVSPTG